MTEEADISTYWGGATALALDTSALWTLPHLTQVCDESVMNLH